MEEFLNLLFALHKAFWFLFVMMGFVLTLHFFLLKAAECDYHNEVILLDKGRLTCLVYSSFIFFSFSIFCSISYTLIQNYAVKNVDGYMYGLYEKYVSETMVFGEPKIVATDMFGLSIVEEELEAYRMNKLDDESVNIQ